MRRITELEQDLLDLPAHEPFLDFYSSQREDLILLELIEREVSMDERRELARDDNALPDDSYPIANRQDLESAIHLARTRHGDVDAAKRLIKLLSRIEHDLEPSHQENANALRT